MSQGQISGGGNRRNRNHHNYGNKNKTNTDEKSKTTLDQVDPNSIVIKQFRMYAAELDAKHDRSERIVKLCRDITIESKRIIFLLHTLDNDIKKEAILSEAKTRLDNLKKTLFKNIALELKDQDPYQYIRSYQGGLQEFVEAATFYQYLYDKNIEDWNHLEKSLAHTISTKKQEQNENEDTIVEETRTLTPLVPPSQYILGIADLTGELMRKCINNLATGDIASCYETCNFVRDMYKGFLGCGGLYVKEINRKVYTLKRSLIKMENICYTIKVRGSEIPKHMLADVANVGHDNFLAENDEGYEPY